MEEGVGACDFSFNFRSRARDYSVGDSVIVEVNIPCDNAFFFASLVDEDESGIAIGKREVFFVDEYAAKFFLVVANEVSEVEVLFLFCFDDFPGV